MGGDDKNGIDRRKEKGLLMQALKELELQPHSMENRPASAKEG